MNTLSIRTDMMSNAIQQNLSYSTDKFNLAMQRLASGLKINSAKDGAANLNISTKMGSTISGLEVANSNINTGISTLSTVNSTYDLITTELQKVRDLAIQASNGTYSAEDCAAINEESNQLIDEINRLIKKSNSSLPTSEESTGFIDYVDKMTEAEAIAAGYDEAHIITSATDFVSKINANRAGSFILVKDIDMSELGTLTNSAITGTFTGKLDGNGCSVNNLSISTTASLTNVGLFSQINSTAIIKNVGVNNVNINAANATYVSGLVGYCNGGEVTNCYVSGSVTGSSYVGGAIGYVLNSNIITDSYSKGNVTGTGNYTGGFIGRCNHSTISNSYSNAHVDGNLYAGGFAGISTNDTKLSNVNAGGDVQGNNYVGGLVGYIYNTGVTSSITSSYATGNASGTSGVGGLVGFSSVSSGITTISTITSSYATGNASGTNYVGGLLGSITYNTVTNSYSSGLVTGNAGTVRGFLGLLNTGSTVDDTNYWDTETSGKTTSAGDAQGVTTQELNEVIAQGTWDDAGYHSEIGRMTLQTGTEKTDTYTINNLKIGIDLSGVDLSDSESASNSLEIIDTSLDTITAQSISLGSSIKILENKVDVNNTQSINLTQSNSTLKDADTAEETVQLVQQQILQQTNAYLLNENRGRLKEILLDLINQGG